MNNTTNVHPNIVREAILSITSHPAKRRNLELIHEVCKEREKAGNKDFSLKAVGDAVEARGGIKAKALWNSQSADYRKLIEAWQGYAGGPKLRELSKANPLSTLTQNIADPATRIVVEKLVSERNALRAEVNILKSQTTLVIDRRPQKVAGASVETADGSMTLEITRGPKLNVLEREAIEHAISLEFWRVEGWQEEKNGRVVKDLGDGRNRTIFKPGFVSAVRKILDAK